MEYISWDKSFETGVKVIDDDHKELVRMINNLHSGLVSGLGISQMTFILNDLIQYTGVHFKREETLMEKHLYPEFDKHKAEHTDLVGSVIDFQEQLKAGRKFFSIELMQFLKNWLVDHILKTDMKLGSFLAEREGSAQ